MRTTGIIFVAVSLALIGMGITSLSRTSAMSGTLGYMSTGQSEPFDPRDWAFHWRISALIIVGLGIVLCGAGIGLVRKRRWGLVLWASVITLMLCAELATKALPVTKYAFEQTSWTEIGAISGIALLSWLSLWRSRLHRKDAV